MVAKANREDGPDKIVFDRRLHGAIKVRESLSLKGPVVVQGAGNRVTLSGSRRGSKLKVLERRKGQRASLRDLRLDRVAVHARAHGEKTRIQIEDSTISGDSGIEDSGVTAGLYRGYDDGVVKVERSLVRGWGQSGVVATWANAKVDRSTVSGNGISGIRATFHGHVDVNASTITGNVLRAVQNDNLGGGLSTYYSADIDLTNSTVAGNRAIGPGGAGGGVGGDITVNGSTITGNSAESGGGVVVFGEGSVANSIVSGNASTGGGAGDCGAYFYSEGGNLIQSPGTCMVRSSDLTGVDPKLGPLKDNGGPTETQALRAGSPAIGLALPRTAPKFDQRGVKRGKDPDAGAYQR